MSLPSSFKRTVEQRESTNLATLKQRRTAIMSSLTRVKKSLKRTRNGYVLIPNVEWESLVLALETTFR